MSSDKFYIKYNKIITIYTHSGKRDSLIISCCLWIFTLSLYSNDGFPK